MFTVIGNDRTYTGMFLKCAYSGTFKSYFFSQCTEQGICK